MSEDGMTDAGAARALELAEGYLEDAENVLWEASRRADSPEMEAKLEALTREVWRVEHAVNDLEGDLRASGEQPRSDARS
jgi:hypothetical protein